jgi:hypothetical protein
LPSSEQIRAIPARPAQSSSGELVTDRSRSSRALPRRAGAREAAADEMRVSRIERAVDTGLAMLAAGERAVGNGGGRDVAEAPGAQPAAQTNSADPCAADSTALRAMPPVPPAPETRVLRPTWMRAGAPPFPGEEPTASEIAARRPIPGDTGPGLALPPASFQDGDLFLVCEAHEGRNLAIPELGHRHASRARGTPEAFTLSTRRGAAGHRERCGRDLDQVRAG